MFPFHKLLFLLVSTWNVANLANSIDIAPISPNEPVTFKYIDYYDAGMLAYKQEKWLACVAYFNEANTKYKIYKDRITSCRRTCNTPVTDREFIAAVNDTENRFLENAIIKTLCTLRCRRSEFGDAQVPYAPSVEDAFEDLMPYHYMQFCYYNAGMVDKALAAAYTFLKANPGHEVMQHNMNLYMEDLKKNGKSTAFENLEPRTYQDEFLKGIEAYDAKDHQGVVKHMETALKAYLEAEEDCRVMCEGPFDQDGLVPDLYIGLANHMTYSLKCRRRCPLRLQQFDGYGNQSEKGNFVTRCYTYLATAFEKLGQTEDACKTVASALLLEPDNKAMNRMQSDLSKQSNIHVDSFTPRPEAKEYFRHNHIDERMLQMIEKDFVIFYRESNQQRKKKPETAIGPEGKNGADNKISDTEKDKSAASQNSLTDIVDDKDNTGTTTAEAK